MELLSTRVQSTSNSTLRPEVSSHRWHQFQVTQARQASRKNGRDQHAELEQKRWNKPEYSCENLKWMVTVYCY